MPQVGVACLVLVAGALMQGCSTIAILVSSWNNHEVVIDGLATEWRAHLFYLEDSQISLGLRNDADFLYICLMAPEEQFQRQMVGLGLMVRLESEDGKKLGIHYPIGLRSYGRRTPVDRGETGDPDASATAVEQALETLEILGPDKEDHQVFSVLETPGISVRVGRSGGSGIYELKVPLRASREYPYAVGTGAGSTVTLGIETGKVEGEMKQGERHGGGRRSGGWGRRGSGSPGGGGREAGESDSARGRRDRPKPVSFWTKVQRSAPPTPR
jgi:hypothetical protein